MLPLYGILLTSTNASDLKCIQWKFLALCCSRFFSQTHYRYVNAIGHINFHSLCTGKLHLDAFFRVNIYNGFKCYPSWLETVGTHIPIRNFTHFSLFAVGSSRRTCPSARCASAANTVCKDTDIFSKHLVTFNDILKSGGNYMYHLL
jgi:hypothetical protein